MTNLEIFNSFLNFCTNKYYIGRVVCRELINAHACRLKPKEHIDIKYSIVGFGLKSKCKKFERLWKTICQVRFRRWNKMRVLAMKTYSN